MTKDQAVKFYGSQGKLAAALGIRQPSISGWKAIPALTQLQLEKITGGALRADPEIWAKVPAPAEPLPSTQGR